MVGLFKIFYEKFVPCVILLFELVFDAKFNRFNCFFDYLIGEKFGVFDPNNEFIYYFFIICVFPLNFYKNDILLILF